MFSPKSQLSLSSLWSYMFLHGKSRTLAPLRVHLLEMRKASNFSPVSDSGLRQCHPGYRDLSNGNGQGSDPGLNKARSGQVQRQDQPESW